MAMIQLIYASRPFGFDAAVLNSILTMARHCNARDDITGALICREDLYLQLLEGPAEMVENAYARISRDGRHLEISQLVKEPITERLFPQWAMRDDPAKSWMWTAGPSDRPAATRWWPSSQSWRRNLQMPESRSPFSAAARRC